jgi:heat shock protein HslJ
MPARATGQALIGATALLALSACTTVSKGTQEPLEGPVWRAIELSGRPTSARNAAREAHLQFLEGDTLSGSDGCNRIVGSYRVQGDRITVGHIAATQMACLDSPGTEGAFRETLAGAARFTVAGDLLELFDATGNRLAVFEAGGGRSDTSTGLAGTSWQLLRFKGSDGTTLTPGAPGKYTLEFGADGHLGAHIDCNRGRGTWTATDGGQISLGPLASTRAMCPPGSLYDQIAKEWGDIRSYVIRDGHLFLLLTADGGVYEFEPAAAATP